MSNFRQKLAAVIIELDGKSTSAKTEVVENACAQMGASGNIDSVAYVRSKLGLMLDAAGNANKTPNPLKCAVVENFGPRGTMAIVAVQYGIAGREGIQTGRELTATLVFHNIEDANGFLGAINEYGKPAIEGALSQIVGNIREIAPIGKIGPAATARLTLKKRTWEEFENCAPRVRMADATEASRAQSETHKIPELLPLFKEGKVRKMIADMSRTTPEVPADYGAIDSQGAAIYRYARNTAGTSGGFTRGMVMHFGFDNPEYLKIEVGIHQTNGGYDDPNTFRRPFVYNGPQQKLADQAFTNENGVWFRLHILQGYGEKAQAGKNPAPKRMVEITGSRVEVGEVEPDSKNTQLIMQIPVPPTKKDIRPGNYLFFYLVGENNAVKEMASHLKNPKGMFDFAMKNIPAFRYQVNADWNTYCAQLREMHEKFGGPDVQGMQFRGFYRQLMGEA